jgi:hypothetical protein
VEVFDAEQMPRGTIAGTEARPRINRTGMIYDETVAPLVDPPRPRFPRLRRGARRVGRAASRIRTALRSSSARPRVSD